jgi:hypothetical protein
LCIRERQLFGYGLDGLARRFDRSVSWVSRRLALVEVLSEAIQKQVREGKIPAQVALKFSAAAGTPQPGGLPADSGGLRPTSL